MPALVFLKTDDDFDQFRRSKLVNSKNFRLRVRFNTNQNEPRFGFIVPKKVLNNVVDRNKVKRRFKTVLQKHLHSIKPADYLWFPNKTLVKLLFNDFEAEVVESFKTLRLWKS